MWAQAAEVVLGDDPAVRRLDRVKQGAWPTTQIVHCYRLDGSESSKVNMKSKKKLLEVKRGVTVLVSDPVDVETNHRKDWIQTWKPGRWQVAMVAMTLNGSCRP